MIMAILVGCGNNNGTIKYPDKPKSDIYVQDNAHMLNDECKKKILAMGKELDNKHHAQIVVVTVDSLNGSDIESYSNELFRQWGIGSKDKNNGILLLISKNDKKFRIEIGYGMEGKITDGMAGEELQKLAPYFKDNKFSEGVFTVYQDLVGMTYEEYGEVQPERETFQESVPISGGFLGDLVLFILSLTLIEQCGIGVLVIIAIIFLAKTGLLEVIFNVLLSCIGDGDDGDGFGGGSSGGGGASGGW
jgi:uncharacterized protein